MRRQDPSSTHLERNLMAVLARISVLEYEADKIRQLLHAEKLREYQEAKRMQNKALEEKQP